jgi:dTDP-4-amino-4,6-dideoxygalactose transaminase
MFTTETSDTRLSIRGEPRTKLPIRVIAKQRIMPLSYARAVMGGTPSDEGRFRAMIVERFPSGTWATPVGRARSGILLLAKIAARHGRRKVLLSPFTIPDVVIMVILAGAEPVFFDCEPNSTFCSLHSLKALIDRETACVLITHYHVNEPRLAEIAEICRAHGAYLFDDCAISFGGSLHGRPLGTLTDASVFSFSSFKLLNFFWGGMITTRVQEIAEAVEATVSQWPRLRGRDYVAPAWTCLKYDFASRPQLFGSVVFPLFQNALRRSAAAEGLERTRIETPSLDPTLTSRPALAAFAEWWPKLGKMDEWLVHRRAIAGIYRHHLGHCMVSADTPEAVIEGSCFVNFPVVVPRERRNEIRRAMMLAGYDVGRSLYPNVHRHPKFIQSAGQSDNVDRLVAGTIYLPTHFGVSPAYANAIAERLAHEIGCAPA